MSILYLREPSFWTVVMYGLVSFWALNSLGNVWNPVYLLQGLFLTHKTNQCPCSKYPCSTISMHDLTVLQPSHDRKPLLARREAPATAQGYFRVPRYNLGMVLPGICGWAFCLVRSPARASFPDLNDELFHSVESFPPVLLNLRLWMEVSPSQIRKYWSFLS